LLVDERNDGGEVGVRERKGRHPFVGATRAHDRTNSIAAIVSGNQRRSRQVGTALTTRRVPAVAEPTLRCKASAASLDLFARVLLRRRRLRRPLRSWTGLSAALRGHRLETERRNDSSHECPHESRCRTRTLSHDGTSI
jgi:hypothetical protein